MLSRRALIGKAAVGAATALALGAARTGLASTRVLPPARDDRADDREGPAVDRVGQKNAPPPADSVATASPPPWELVSPLVAGSVVAHGWRLGDLSPVQDGSCVVTL